jgi:type I restriction enzyme S subunit
MLRSIRKFKETEIGPIPEGWDVVRITDIAANFDSKRRPLSSAERQKMAGTFPYFGAAGVIDYVNNWILDGRFLLVAEDGSVSDENGYPTLQITNGKFWVSNHAHVLSCDDETDLKYLYYFLKRTVITPYVTGAVQPKLNQENLNAIPIVWPSSKDERTQIVDALSSFDHKIELNRRININVEQIASALFKHWFVDFEFPDSEGRPYKSSGGKMRDSELGSIPFAWRIATLGDLTHVTMGLSPKGESYNDFGQGMPLLNGAADFKGKIILPKKYTTAPTRLCDKGDLVMCIRATIGNLTFADRAYCLGRGVAAFKSKDEIFNEYVYFVIIRALDSLISKASGSVISGLTKPDIEDLTVLLPEEKLLKMFHNQASAIIDYEVDNDRANVMLEQARDSLLPRLMSGMLAVYAR